MKKIITTTALLLSATTLTKVNASPQTAILGTDFNVTHVAGDGNCGFSSIGKSRAEVTAALKAAVSENFDAYRTFDQRRSQLHNLVAGLSADTDPTAIGNAFVQVQTFINSSSGVSSSPSAATSPSTLANQALAEFRDVLEGRSNQSFSDAQRVLQSRIQNMYYERYEAFQVALKEELIASHLSASNLESKAGLLSAIDRVFARNTGKASWLPVGLIFGVNDRLGLNLAVWSSRGAPADTVTLYQFSSPSGNVWDPSVRHVVWNGSHVDILQSTR